MSGSSKQKILITGINGFLGSHLAKLLSRDYEIIGLEYSTKNLFRIKDFNFKVYASNEDVEVIFKEHLPHIIIHAATVYKREQEPLEPLLNTNIFLPVKLFELANQYGTKLFINSDSFFNDSKLKYSYLQDYTLSKKQVLEWLTLICNSNKKCKLVNLKIFHMYGKHDSQNKFIPYIVTKIISKTPFIDLTRGEQTRDFVFINDVISSYKAIISKLEEIDLYSDFEVGTGVETSVKELILKIKEVFKNDTTTLNFGALDYRDNEIMKSKANIKDLNKLGWEPMYNLELGIEQLLEVL